MQPLETQNSCAKIVFKLVSVFIRSLLFLTFALGLQVQLSASDTLSSDTSSSPSLQVADSSFPPLGDTTSLMHPDSAGFSTSDTLARDSLGAGLHQTKAEPKKSPIEDEIKYSAKDSMRIVLADQQLFLYGEAKVTYMDIELTADYIVLDLANEEVFAKGTPDTLGKVVGKPNFKQGSQVFNADSLRYNFRTESGIIYHIITQQGDGYLHSEKTKRHPNEHIHIQDGKYTTCDAEHPHFYLALKKGIVIPDDKIITGMAYMVVADIPINFVGIPFGFFPNSNKRSSGLLMPTYGEEQKRGMYLRDLGWYQVLGDYADFTIQGDWYSKGSWAVRNNLAYKWRYHFSGDFAFDYATNKDNDDPSFQVTKDYALKWSHRQDPKANPTQNFSASVNFRSSGFDSKHSYNTEDYTTNNTNSSISYTKRWPASPFNLSLSANANQNKQKQTVLMSLPTGSLNMSSIYPLRKKSSTGSYKWYENISLSYSSSFKNELNTYEPVLFDSKTWSDSLQNGLRHDIPLSVNFKLGKMITLTPSLQYSGVMYTHSKRMGEFVTCDSVTGEYNEEEITTQVEALSYEQAINPTMSINIAPKMFGMLQSTREDSYVEAIRHVVSPKIGLSFTPDMHDINDRSYYDTIYKLNANGEKEMYRVYNYYEDELSFLSPPSSNGKAGSVRLGLNNNLEMKVRPRNDTTGQSKKVSILDNLNFNTAYNPFKDSLRWSSVSMVTGTRLFNNKLDVRVNGQFDPYATDPKTGRQINTFYYKQSRKLLRMTSLSVNTSFTLKSKEGDGDKNSSSDDGPAEGDESDPMYNEASGDEYLGDDFLQGYADGTYVDFNAPWSVNVQHSWSLQVPGKGESKKTHTVKLSGDLKLTPKIKIGGNLNYDIQARKTSFTSINFYRDLHCWEMLFTVIPYGPRQSFSFTIRAKSAMLRDLKYEKKPNWYDQF